MIASIVRAPHPSPSLHSPSEPVYTPASRPGGNPRHFPTNFLMRVRASIKRLSADCQIVKRRGVLYVICKRNPRLKQKQKCGPRNKVSSRRQNWRRRRRGAPYKSWKQR